MAAILSRDDVPNHLLNIPKLDFSGDLFAERLAGPWFRLGASFVGPRRPQGDVEDVVMRQSVLLDPKRFTTVFDKLESVGSVLHGMGAPGGSVRHVGSKKRYRYDAFHQFEFPFTSVVGEPLVFLHHDTSGAELFINPDLSLFFELEERSRGNGIWWDPRRGVEALVRRVIDEGNLETVEIRVDYLVNYLRARQMSLVVGHYRHLHLLAPSEEAVSVFVKGNLTIGSPKQGTKAILQNCGLRNDIGGTPFLQRRLHLWFEIKPEKIDAEDPWAEEPPLDPYTFTLPTRSGAVAPARWKTHLRHREGRTYEGETCDFMELVYFRQEVLMKYQGSSGFDIKDDGSVRYRGYWGLDRSTYRIGNELLGTFIGDFADGVPSEEWPHWKQYAVEPPSADASQALLQEPINVIQPKRTSHVGKRGVESHQACRQLKWVYPATADDDEFLKRATLTSTLVIEGLHTPSLRRLLSAVGANLHQNSEDKPLGSRKLLQRVTLLALLIDRLRPLTTELPTLVTHAEGHAKYADEPDLQSELEGILGRVRNEFAPLALLYDLRIHGGLAHSPNKERVATAAAELGLPKENWHRVDYLRLLRLVAESIHRIGGYLEAV